MTDLELLDQILSETPIVIQKPFYKVTGDLKSAIFLSQIYYWSKKMNHDWFYKTMEELESETYLTAKEQQRIRKVLKALGVIKENFKKTPPKLHFKFELQRFIELAKHNYSQPLPKVIVDETCRNKEPLPLVRVTKGNGQPLPKVKVLYKEQKITTEDYIRDIYVDEEKTEKSKVERIPCQEIIAIYHRILPMLRGVEVLNDRRKTNLRIFWNQKITKLTNPKDMQWWEDYFTYVRDHNPWLMGSHRKSTGWKADFDFLTKAANVLNICEGKYEERREVI